MSEKDFNVETEVKDIDYIQGNGFDMSWEVKKNSVALNMTGMQLDMYIYIKYPRRTLMAHYSSAGSSPAITISSTTMNIVFNDLFNADNYDYYIDLTDGTEVMTIRKGSFIVGEK